ncbi:MAG: hypothetical protein ACKVRP_09930 [Bacteroidota bacterium]
MKKILSLAMLTVLVSAMAFAQGGQSSATTALFSVGAELVVAATEGEFLDLSPGTTYTISADGAMAPADVAGEVEAVPILWELEGQPGAAVVITFSLPSFFEGEDQGVRVPYTVNTQSAGWAAEGFALDEPYNPIDARVPNTIFLIGGVAAVQLGGILSVPVGAPAADYIGQFVLTAAYAGL